MIARVRSFVAWLRALPAALDAYLTLKYGPVDAVHREAGWNIGFFNRSRAERRKRTMRRPPRFVFPREGTVRGRAHRTHFRVEWSLFRWKANLSVEMCPGDEDPLVFGIGIPLLGSFWLMLDPFWMRGARLRRMWRARYKSETMEIRVGIHNARLWWSLWHPANSWESGTPFWQHGNIEFARVLCGRLITQRVVHETHEAVLVRDDGTYNVQIEMVEIIHRRPRWFTRHWRFASFNLATGQAIDGITSFGVDDVTTRDEALRRAAVKQFRR